MDDRQKVAATKNPPGTTGQSRKTQQRRTFAVTAAAVQPKPAPSKSITKVHALGTLPKYLQRQPKPKDSKDPNGVRVEDEPELSGQPAPAEPVMEPGVVLPSSVLEIEHQKQTMVKLQRAAALLDELGDREKKVRELESKLEATRANFSEMETLMREHLHRRGDWMPDMKGNQTDGKITLLLLKMTLDSWPGCS